MIIKSALGSNSNPMCVKTMIGFGKGSLYLDQPRTTRSGKPAFSARSKPPTGQSTNSSTNPPFLRTPALSHCLAKVTLTNFQRKLMKLCPMLADIFLYGWLCLNRIGSNHPNLVNQALLEFFTLGGREELQLGLRDQVLQRLRYRILYEPTFLEHVLPRLGKTQQSHCKLESHASSRIRGLESGHK